MMLSSSCELRVVAVMVLVGCFGILVATEECDWNEYYNEGERRCNDCSLLCASQYESSAECAERCPRYLTTSSTGTTVDMPSSNTGLTALVVVSILVVIVSIVIIILVCYKCRKQKESCRPRCFRLFNTKKPNPETQPGHHDMFYPTRVGHGNQDLGIRQQTQQHTQETVRLFPVQSSDVV